ncbi:G-protein coupled receptor 55 isoform X2 [Gadus morhua]|uniref:G-protein coupled receptor 55 isoform X2 n=1 Tax=Gadus morhua TaxID=8049 RepID=UPI0011B3ED04|nr:G-protein coupled receptor 55-like isoform X2 [Gadus morhua]
MNNTMATSNCSFEEVDHLMKTLELVFYVPIFLCGVAVNGWALFVFCFKIEWRVSTIYFTNLVLMDLILLVPLPFKMHATNHRWTAQSKGLCSFLESLYFIGMYGSVYTIACIAVDRWLGICHLFNFRKPASPVIRDKSRRNAVFACVVVWLAVLAPPSLIYGFRDHGHEDFHCFHGFSPKVWRPAIIVCLEVLGYVLPALVIVFCSVRSAGSLNDELRELSDELRKQSDELSAKKRLSIRVIYSSMWAFLVPFTPSHLAILLQFLVALCLANVTCCLDAPCYYFAAKEVRSIMNFRRQSSLKRLLSLRRWDRADRSEEET